MTQLTQETLKRLLSYDADSGLFTRLVSVGRAKRGDVAGCRTPYGYIYIKIGKTLYAAHRLAFLYVTGKMPDAYIDHINGVRDDNRLDNLRDVTRHENGLNQRTYANNTSGHIGVSRHTRESAWLSSIQAGGKRLIRNFADSKYGGKDLAFMAASFFAVNKRIELGFHENHGISAIAGGA